MGPFTVTDIGNMRLILETFSQLDDMRWGYTSNYTLINYCSDDLTPDEKLLTHWLCYITDRQMPYQRIWDVGGYVISHLVRSYTRDDYDDVWSLVDSYIRRKKDGKIYLECSLREQNDRLERYGINSPVQFSSKYMPEDITLIFRTLEILSKLSDYSFSKYIYNAIGGETAHSRAIRKIAAAFEELTYASAGSVSTEKFRGVIRSIKRELKNYQLEIDEQEELFGRKRLWCSLRDYLKSPEFNPILTSALASAGLENSTQWGRNIIELRDALYVLELPGDIWNNSSAAGRC